MAIPGGHACACKRQHFQSPAEQSPEGFIAVEILSSFLNMKWMCAWPGMAWSALDTIRCCSADQRSRLTQLPCKSRSGQVFIKCGRKATHRLPDLKAAVGQQKQIDSPGPQKKEGVALLFQPGLWIVPGLFCNGRGGLWANGLGKARRGPTPLYFPRIAQAPCDT